MKKVNGNSKGHKLKGTEGAKVADFAHCSPFPGITAFGRRRFFAEYGKESAEARVSDLVCPCQFLPKNS